MTGQLVPAGDDQVHVVPTLSQGIRELNGVVQQAPEAGGLDHSKSHRPPR
jgi:hypothetical protein